MTKSAPVHPACHRCGYATTPLRPKVRACLHCGLEHADDRPQEEPGHDGPDMLDEIENLSLRLGYLLDLNGFDGVFICKMILPDGRRKLHADPVIFAEEAPTAPSRLN